MNLVFDIEGNIVSLYVMVVESSTISQGKQKTFQASNLIVNEMKISKELWIGGRFHKTYGQWLLFIYC